jgi:hypothetical protein
MRQWMLFGIFSFGRCEEKPTLKDHGWSTAGLIEPFTAVGQPPTEGEDRERGGHSPPERQDQIGEKTDASKAHPENLALHRHSLACFGEQHRESLAKLCCLRYNEEPTVTKDEEA